MFIPNISLYNFSNDTSWVWYHPEGQGSEEEKKEAREYNSGHKYKHLKLFQLFMEKDIEYEQMGEFQFSVILIL